jgi:hypothetical protein
LSLVFFNEVELMSAQLFSGVAVDEIHRHMVGHRGQVLEVPYRADVLSLVFE